eukprot:06603.XXX_296027_296143_1 [CDS] Oithona nana genome sequencing.
MKSHASIPMLFSWPCVTFTDSTNQIVSNIFKKRSHFHFS